MAVAPRYAVAIDPGVHMTAVAYFENGKLSDAVYLPTTAMSAVIVTQIYAERPRMRERSPVRKQTIADLSLALGLVVSRFAGPQTAIRYIEPTTWKGTVDKAITGKRITAALSSAERCVLANALEGIEGKLQHNVYDAVGIGLFGLGRVGRGCVR